MLASKGASLAAKVTASPLVGTAVKTAIKAPKTTAAAVAGAATAVGGVVSALSKNKDQEKKAAVDLLVHTGVDFDSAVGMVHAKAQELYQ